MIALIFFPASCIARVNYLRFITSIHIFSNFSNIVQGSNKNFCHFVVPTPISQKVFQKVSQEMYFILPARQNWIEFLSKMPIVKQLFCRRARWVPLYLSEKKLSQTGRAEDLSLVRFAWQLIYVRGVFDQILPKATENDHFETVFQLCPSSSPTF